MTRPSPRVALLCSGLGNIHRGHEVFARGLFDLLRDDLDITLFKGGGDSSPREIVVPNIARNSPLLANIHPVASPKWREAAVATEQMRIEGETFAWNALPLLLQGGYEVVHCLEQEVATCLYRERHLFEHIPRFLWSNGGALHATDIPPCDFVQEHTDHNLRRSVRSKAFVIPHGVDVARFDPGVPSTFRADHGIPADALLVASVGAISFWHKRMDYVVREVAAVAGAWLVVVGQPTVDTPAIKALADSLAPGRVLFLTLPHEQVPSVLAAADVFTLGSLFETFGIAYIEAMAMQLPVISTDHANQREIIGEGLFVDMSRPGALAAALRDTPRDQLAALGRRGRAVVLERYDLSKLKSEYLRRYAQIAKAHVTLPALSTVARTKANLRSLWRRARGIATVS